MKYIFANWKLNPKTVKAARQLVLAYSKKSRHKVVVAPPVAFLGSLDFPNLSGQDCFPEEFGPYTGQVSVLQLKDLGVKYCIVGHSEKRRLKESDAEVNEKVRLLMKNRITPVVCVGYGTTANMSDAKMYAAVAKSVQGSVPAELRKKVIVAYEPVWSISKGDPHKTAKKENPGHANEISRRLKKDLGVAKVIYGGSVSEENASGFLSEKDLDGLLVGGASLNAKEFNIILAS